MNVQMNRVRLEGQNRDIKQEVNTVDTTKQFEGPMYFNIIEENPISWKLYVYFCGM